MGKFSALLLSIFLIFASCRGQRLLQVGLICRDFPEDAPAELQATAAFVRGVLEDSGLLPAMGLRLAPPETAAPDLVLELYSCWGFEAADSGDEYLTVARTYLVPRADASNLRFAEGGVQRGSPHRGDTSLTACLAGEETLIPLRELAAPGIALRVDGLAAGDAGYPLVWETRVRLAAGGEAPAENGAGQGGGIAATGTLLAGLLRERLSGAPNPLLETRPQLFWLAAAGDLMLGRGAGDILLREGPGGIFGESAAAMLAAADLAIVNLEGALSDRGSRVEKTYNFRFPPGMAGALRDTGIDAVLLANNHVYDFGPDAFLDTLTHLEAAGIGILGAGRDLETAAAPFVFAKAGVPPVHVFGIASFPREASGWDGLSIAAGERTPGILHAGRGGADRLPERFSAEALDLVFFHGGNEWTTAPDARTRALYTALARAGADIIIGSHPHIVQGFEWIAGKPIFWSLGNFVFAGMENTGGGDEGLLIRLGFLGTALIYIEPYTLALSGARTKIVP